ncbi:hypothetical protein J2X36_000025 [Methylobacterium sp. BE186]|uniref:hypothetical protein n=1 Tax=Methylobacterium sp. BE186 TaxID=2817715 RepID=UPI002865C74D|nr:hypothetical protein [Methylobacterium sp. BE186]MDR7035290.1 hypothetical protein [Methylobacterium sp. BE186]
MRFFIDHDRGDSIRGWVVPDHPTAISRVVVSVEGQRVAEVSATLFDENFRKFGWHATGQCTFMITEAEVPGLAGFPRLEIYDTETNVLVHRRVPEDTTVAHRLLLINTSIIPETVIQSLLFRHFRQSYFGLEKLSDDMLQSVCGNPALVSCCVSGGLLVQRYEPYFPSERWLTAVLVHDPYVEMAARLTWLGERAALAADPAQNWRLGRLVDAASFVGEQDMSTSRGLKRLFQTMPETVYKLLYNPFTRQFGTSLPDIELRPSHSIAAIETLAHIGLVGHRDHYEAFMASLLDRLGIEESAPQAHPVPAAVLDLADRLRKLSSLEEMIVFDVAISDAVRSAVAKNWR